MSSSRYLIEHAQARDISVKLLYITTSSYDEDWNSLLHTHHFSELFYVLNGRGKFILEDESFEVEEDDLVIINPKVLHTEASVEGEPFQYVALGIDGLSFLFGSKEEDDTPQIRNYNIFNYRRHRNDMRYRFKTMISEIENKATAYEFVCQNMLEVLLVYVARYSECSLSLIPTNKVSRECAFLKQYIDIHFKEDITLDSLSALIHMNKFYMSHAFSKSYGMSPINYLIEKRVSESKYLLENTDYSLSQISQIVGFSSPSYFSQTFKRIVKQSPKEFRQCPTVFDPNL